jgi:hypothetical protein
MKPKYRIYLRGPVPSNLKERIVAIHAEGIMKAKNDDLQALSQGLTDQIGKKAISVVYSAHR